MDIDKRELVELRHWVHAHPEVAWEEKETANHVIEFLEKYPPDKILRPAGHGIAAVYTGKEEGPAILIRAELDALPIDESNTNLHYRSKNDGKAHKCGHDGHLTMVAGLAPWLHANRPEKGRAILLFQPAEETGEGAKAVYKDDSFREIAPDFAFALHNIPGYSKGTILCKTGTFSAAVMSVIIKLKGSTAHAGEPEKGTNPALAMAEIIKVSDQLPNRDPEHSNFTLITPIHAWLGDKAYGTAAGYGELHFTLRAWSNKSLKRLSNRFVNLVENIAGKYSLQLSVNWTQEFLANKNDEAAVKMIGKAARDNELDYEEIEQPFRWGEDFGMISSKVRGAMFGIGAGKDSAALHNPDYDFPDEILTTGVQMYKTLIAKLLNE